MGSTFTPSVAFTPLNGDEGGKPLTYALPQYINPMHYDSDLEEILMGSHRPDELDSCTYEAP